MTAFLKKVLSLCKIELLSTKHEKLVWSHLAEDIAKESRAYIQSVTDLSKSHYPGLHAILGITFDMTPATRLNDPSTTTIECWKLFENRISSHIKSLKSLLSPPVSIDFTRPISIVGAGYAGLLMALACAKKGFTDIRVFEKREEHLSATRFQGLVVRDPKELDELCGEPVSEILTQKGAISDAGGLASMIGVIQTVLRELAESKGVQVLFHETVDSKKIHELSQSGTVICCTGKGDLKDTSDHIILPDAYKTTMHHTWSVSVAPPGTVITVPRSKEFGRNWYFKTDRLISAENPEVFDAFIAFMMSHGKGKEVDSKLIEISKKSTDQRPKVFIRLLSHNGMVSKAEINDLRSQFFSDAVPISLENTFSVDPVIKVHAFQDGVIGLGDILGGPHPLAGLGTRRIARSVGPVLDYICRASAQDAPDDLAIHQEILNLNLYLQSATILAINVFESQFSNPLNWK